MCSIMRGDQVLEQQNCKALSDAGDPMANTDVGKPMTYVWPSGNRTVVGGSDEDFSVNGNLAIPLPDSGRGLCLKVEKTGNTFCFKEGARVKVVAAQPGAATGAIAAASAGNGAPAHAVAKPVETKPAEPKPAAGAPTVVAAVGAPAATATGSPLANKLAEEVKLRQAAEKELELLKSEISRLNEIEEKRLAELADQHRSTENDEKKKSEDAALKADAEKARAAALAQDRESFESRCTQGDAVACEAAIALVKGTSDTVDPEVVTELELMLETARKPSGVTSLATVPRSTWAMGAIASILALAVIALSLRRREQRKTGSYDAEGFAEGPPPIPSLDAPPEFTADGPTDPGPDFEIADPPPVPTLMPSPPPGPGAAPSLSTALAAAAPSLDPFASLPRPSDPFVPAPPLLSLETAAPARSTPPPLPPPIPRLSTMDALYPPKSG